MDWRARMAGRRRTLRFTATHDGLGHIACRCTFTKAYGSMLAGASDIELEAGALAALAADAARFEETSTT